MNTYRSAIKEIIKFKRIFDKIDPKIPRKLVGEIGEFYALRELCKRGFKKIRHKGGQSGYDIYLEDNGKRIEVRTSLLKSEGVFPKNIQFFGWRVKNRNQKKKAKFDVMIGLALDNTFKYPKFYIFTYKEAFSVGDVKIGRFNNVQKKIYLFKDKRAYKEAIRLKPNLVTKYERYINKHPDRFRNKWSKI